MVMNIPAGKLATTAAALNDRDITQAVFSLRMHGFAVIHNALSADETAALRETNTRCLPEFGADSLHFGVAAHITSLPRCDPVYWPLIDHPRVLPVLEAVLGNSLILSSLNCRVIRPGEGPQRFHSDMPEKIRKLNGPLMLNTVWMVDDFTSENGATRIVPGSHLYPVNPWSGPQYVDNSRDNAVLTRDMFPAPEAVSEITGKAGTVAVFDGRCWHAGGRNRTGRDRHAIFGNYRMGTWMRFQVDPHEGFDPAWVPRLNDNQRHLMRMERGLNHPTGSDWRIGQKEDD